MASETGWRKSSYSGGQGGNCIEVADADSRVIVRDSKDSQGAILRFSPDAWRRFADRVKGSLASDSQSGCRGHSHVRECPLYYVRCRAPWRCGARKTGLNAGSF